jgi:hypothetical protein
MPSFPPLLHAISIIALALGVASAITITLDECRRPQAMWIMNLVWPLCALFGSLLWLFGYYRWGRAKPPMPAHHHGMAMMHHHGGDGPFPISVAIDASHCGAGCALGDLIAEWLAFFAPAVAVWCGWHWLFAEKMFAIWVLDFILAYVLGIAFQYYAIKPMRDLTVGQALVAALKADTASITAWQIGMYGVMAIIQFGWFMPAYGGMAMVTTPEFWFAMQLSMLAGFVTSYPVNWLLIRAGIKAPM